MEYSDDDDMDTQPYDYDDDNDNMDVQSYEDDDDNMDTQPYDDYMTTQRYISDDETQPYGTFGLSQPYDDFFPTQRQKEYTSDEGSRSSFEKEQSEQGSEQEEVPEYRAERGAYERTAIFGNTTQFINPATYMQTRSDVEVARDELNKIIEIYEKNISVDAKRKLQQTLPFLENVQFYNPLVLVLSSIFVIHYSLRKKDLDEFYQKFSVNVPKEDIIRHVRKIKSLNLI